MASNDYTMTGGLVLHLPELTRTNYQFWLNNLYVILDEKDLTKYVDRNVPCPPTIADADGYETQASAEARKTWRQQSRSIAMIIHNSAMKLESFLLPYGYEATELNPFVLFRAIKAALGTVSAISLKDASTKFHALQLVQYASPIDYLTKFQSLANKIKGTGYDVPDLLKCTFLLRKFKAIDPVLVRQLDRELEHGEIDLSKLLKELSERFAQETTNRAHTLLNKATSQKGPNIQGNNRNKSGPAKKNEGNRKAKPLRNRAKSE
ncbi:hypothetical protein SPI_04947 [Niveomyces insectorum RCEF 264]|uniref:Uncharacterized protein n=1 Tax=Niveomyces insectorum RCEF 264 TaxID=1081102 RepID=A0A167TT93_9HYPO|nr:hypothetical protein SPI_04947 [Niveomyces insectorum RCEF 264]